LGNLSADLPDLTPSITALLGTLFYLLRWLVVDVGVRLELKEEIAAVNDEKNDGST
jgi:hypothetical protein